MSIDKDVGARRLSAHVARDWDELGRPGRDPPHPADAAVASGPLSDEYIDISGSAVFRITCTPSDGCANVIGGYAITGVYADLNDPGLRQVRCATCAWN